MSEAAMGVFIADLRAEADWLDGTLRREAVVSSYDETVELLRLAARELERLRTGTAGNKVSPRETR